MSDATNRPDDAAEDKNSPHRDWWDLINKIASIVSIIFIPVLTISLNTIFQEREREVNKLLAMEKFFPYLKQDADQRQQQVAIYIMYNLGYKDIAVRIAALDASEASISSLEQIITIEGDKEKKEMALKMLNKLKAAPQEQIQKRAELALAKVQQSEPLKTGTAGIVIGADKTLDEARHEVKRAKIQGFGDVAIYRRQGMYRTVLRFPSREEAEKALPKIREIVRDSSYLVILDKWCPNAKETENGLVFECPSAD
ncbi:MAG TPA: hypothetical protein DCY27_11110 [Desulfobacterales bacterium]|nr:hypothetical protein [Desulfobacterales bacterium]